MTDIDVPRSVGLDSSVTELDGVGDVRAQTLAAVGIETVADVNDADSDDLQDAEGIGTVRATRLSTQASKVWLRETRPSIQERGSDPSWLTHDADLDEIEVAIICSQQWTNGRASRDLQARVREAISEVSDEQGARVQAVHYLDGADSAPSNAFHKVVGWALEDLNDRLPDRAQIYPFAHSIPWTSLPDVPEWRDPTSHDKITRGSNGDLIWLGAPKAATQRITDTADVLVLMDEHDFAHRDIRYAQSQRTDVYCYGETPDAFEPDPDQRTTADVRTASEQSDDPAFDPSPMDTDRGRENPYAETQATLEEEDRYADWTKFDRNRKSG